MKKLERISELDGLRGLAICMVVFWHYFSYPLVSNQNNLIDNLKYFTSWTWSGVDLFFVLSGFLITRILISYRKSKNYYLTFYIRRICRIFPLYYLFLASYVAMLLSPWGKDEQFFYLFGNPLPIFSYISFTHNYFMAQSQGFASHWIAIYWSLAVEEQFYLVLPLIIRLFSLRMIPIFFLLSLALSLALRIYMPGFQSLVLLQWHSDSLVVGGLIAWAHTNYREQFQVLATPLAINTVLGLLIGLRFLSLNFPKTFEPFEYLWFALFYGTTLTLVLFNSKHVFSRFTRSKTLAHIGGVSYAFYIFHQAVNGSLHLIFLKQIPVIDSALSFFLTLLALLLTYLLTRISWILIEKRAINFGHKFTYDPTEPLPR